MDGKVILTVFGVVLLLAAIFFFFKSFASHEQRMQTEQELRMKMEREKLEAERLEANRPLTPEEIAQRRKLEEVRLKAEQARKAAADAARAEAARKKLEQQAELEKQRAEREKELAEQARQAEELRLKQVAEANKLAEEARAKAEAEAKARQEQDRKQQAAGALADLTAWKDAVIQQAATAYPVKVQPPSPTGANRVYVFNTGNSAVVANAVSYNSPEEVPGFATWSEDMVVAFCKQAMTEDASRQDPVVTPPEVFGRIALVDDAGALKDLYKNLAGQVFKAQDADASARKNQAVFRNLISMGLRQMDKLDKQEAELDKGPGTSAVNPRAVGGPTGATPSQLKDGIRAEKQKTIEKLRSQVSGYWKAMTETRGTVAAIKLLNDAKRLTADRLGELGVTDLAATTATTSTPKEGAAYKLVVLKDGTEIKAYTMVKMGEQWAVKDENGEMKTLEASDVKEVKKP